jgi:hypothetical protein
VSIPHYVRLRVGQHVRKDCEEHHGQEGIESIVGNEVKKPLRMSLFWKVSTNQFMKSKAKGEATTNGKRQLQEKRTTPMRGHLQRIWEENADETYTSRH